ncbi:hypothetical protein DXU93_06070 [Brumimicrobium aurantiacum]|uniref:Lipocalin-like domain-containing protein n=2 Tax=Brumimicrobium aurantiacum TaxID=1737063 RepID=A0A3E1EYC5_9FLAO|nr:hypothetical protein DXU93_06070 [Brumimicrobium aurantiacum]
MKNKMKYILPILSVLFVLTACSKYEEGPAFSLLTKKSRITGDWKTERKIDKEGDEEFYYTDQTIRILKTGEYEVHQNKDIVIDGEWEFANDNNDFRITYELDENENSEEVLNIEEFEIIRLKSTELWLKDIYGVTIKYVPAM